MALNSKSLGYVQNNTFTSAKTLADITTVPETADYAEIQVEAQTVRYRFDGTAPTASVGFTLAIGTVLRVSKGQFADFKMIQTGATAIINVEFFKTG